MSMLHPVPFRAVPIWPRITHNISSIHTFHNPPTLLSSPPTISPTTQHVHFVRTAAGWRTVSASGYWKFPSLRRCSPPSVCYAFVLHTLSLSFSLSHTVCPFQPCRHSLKTPPFHPQTCALVIRSISHQCCARPVQQTPSGHRTTGSARPPKGSARNTDSGKYWPIFGRKIMSPL